MRTYCVIGIILVLALAVRVYASSRPWKFTDGDIVKLNIQTGRWGEDDTGKLGVVHKGLWLAVPKGSTIRLGQRLRVIGRVEVKVIDNRIWQKIQSYSDIVIFDDKKGLFDDLKFKLVKWLPGDTGPLAAGILFGESRYLTAKGESAFRDSGLSHVVAASGYNVAVVAGTVMALLRRLIGRRWAIPFGIVCITLYVIIAGATAAVVRAGVMASLTLVAMTLGRRTEAIWILGITIWLMLFVRPEWTFDIGFQLSVAATIGLLVGGVREPVWWKSDLKTSIIAQIVTLPIILHYFGNISVWAPIVNVLVLWSVPWIMEIAGLAVLAGIVAGQIGMAVSFLAWPLLTYMIFVVETAADWPGNGFRVGFMSWWWIAGYYGVVAFLWWAITRRKRR